MSLVIYSTSGAGLAARALKRGSPSRGPKADMEAGNYNLPNLFKKRPYWLELRQRKANH